MYEKPELNRVGAAQDVILGMIPTGDDMDMNFMTNEMQFADDGD
jgi:hypothetical protein